MFADYGDIREQPQHKSSSKKEKTIFFGIILKIIANITEGYVIFKVQFHMLLYEF